MATFLTPPRAGSRLYGSGSGSGGGSGSGTGAGRGGSASGGFQSVKKTNEAQNALKALVKGFGENLVTWQAQVKQIHLLMTSVGGLTSVIGAVYRTCHHTSRFRLKQWAGSVQETERLCTTLTGRILSQIESYCLQLKDLVARLNDILSSMKSMEEDAHRLIEGQVNRTAANSKSRC